MHDRELDLLFQWENHYGVHQVKPFGCKYCFFVKLIKSLDEELIKLSAPWLNKGGRREGNGTPKSINVPGGSLILFTTCARTATLRLEQVERRPQPRSRTDSPSLRHVKAGIGVMMIGE